MGIEAPEAGQEKLRYGGRTPKLLYLHGFRSSSASQKVSKLRAWLARNRPDVELIVPDLPPGPADALELVRAILERHESHWLGVVGSSLGGYYAAHVAHNWGMPAVLINPAIRPAELFVHYLGEHENLYSGLRFTLEHRHLAELLQWETDSTPQDARLLVLLETGDDTLDFRRALAAYPHHPAWIRPGGSHVYEHFEAVLPEVLDFLCWSRG